MDWRYHGCVSEGQPRPPRFISRSDKHYPAVGQLIVNRDVTVFMSKTGGLSALAEVLGEYWHEENLFMIYNMEPRARRLNFVHEGTHTIQDWQTAYKNVVAAVGQVYPKYGVRIDHIKKGDGSSERTKYKALWEYITTANKIRDGVLDTVAEKLESVLP